ncbi:MAG TPA: hypothetical protein VFH88_11375, partial [Candidatus Krumholzibacteria bacterium]|nr:hypothetical protein [Candidatus Krumholzibacteria bacterium]
MGATLGQSQASRFKDVTFIYLDGTNITDDGLQQLSGFSNLETLWIGNSQVTDDGLQHPSALP